MLFGGGRDAEAVLQRLDRLTQDEARTTAAEILNVVHGLVQDMSEKHTILTPYRVLSALAYRWEDIRWQCHENSGYILLATIR